MLAHIVHLCLVIRCKCAYVHEYSFIYADLHLHSLATILFYCPCCVCLQNGSNAVMLACFGDFPEALTALVEEFKMDVMAKDYVCMRVQ